MANDFPRDDELQALWQQQPVTEMRMTAEELRGGAEKFQARIRRRNRIEYAAALLVAVGCLFTLAKSPGIWHRAWALLTMAGVGYVCRHLYRQGSAAAVPADLALQPGLEFHRSQLERQRDLLRGVWSWYLLPLVPGLVVGIIGSAQLPGRLRPTLIYAAIVACLFCGIGWLNRRAASKLQQQIDRLNSMSR